MKPLSARVSSPVDWVTWVSLRENLFPEFPQCQALVGAPIAGRIADRIVTSWKRKRGGVWYPEDWLRATFSGGLIFVPLSVLGCGLVTTYIEGPLGLTLNLILLFLNGLGVRIENSPSLNIHGAPIG